MLRDNTLIPTEAIRLAALGMLTQGPRSYAELAAEVRYFISRVMGPSLELLGTSIELLKYEGFVGARGESADAPLELTADGRAELIRLLGSNVRPLANDLNKLVMGLKIRFLHLLPDGEQAAQFDLMAEAYEGEIARLSDLRACDAGDGGHLGAWLDHEIAFAEARLAWLCEAARRKGGQ